MSTRTSTPFAHLLLGACFALCAAQAGAQMGPPPPKSEVAKRIEAAMASDIRTPEERARDARERKPVQTLEFFGLQPNMRVLELFPAGGWYTKILAPVLADEGKLYIAIGADRLAPRLKEWKLDKVEVAPAKATPQPSGQFGVFKMDSVDLGVKDLDMILTFRNVHNLTADTRAQLNKAAFAALKPGGVYGIVDHTRRHNEPGTVENWRRIDPVVVIKEALDAGFVFEAFSDLHYRPDDELRFDTARPSIANYSDRFTLRFRKPAK
jgi:predicted methyltransferase